MKKINQILALALCLLLSAGVVFADNDKTDPNSGINPAGKHDRPGFDNGNAWWKGNNDNGGGGNCIGNCPQVKIHIVDVAGVAGETTVVEPTVNGLSGFYSNDGSWSGGAVIIDISGSKSAWSFDKVTAKSDLKGGTTFIDTEDHKNVTSWSSNSPTSSAIAFGGSSGIPLKGCPNNTSVIKETLFGNAFSSNGAQIVTGNDNFSLTLKAEGYQGATYGETAQVSSSGKYLSGGALAMSGSGASVFGQSVVDITKAIDVENKTATITLSALNASTSTPGGQICVLGTPNLVQSTLPSTLYGGGEVKSNLAATNNGGSTGLSLFDISYKYNTPAVGSGSYGGVASAQTKIVLTPGSAQVTTTSKVVVGPVSTPTAK
jgi:hypothetical protein